MLSEALKYFAGLANRSQKPEVITIRNTPRKAWIAFNGSLADVTLEQSPREHIVDSLESLMEIAAHSVFESYFIWVSPVHIEIRDDDRHESHVRMPLRTSAMLQALMDHSHKPMSHRKFLQVMRTEFDTLLPSGFLAQYAKADFARLSSASSAVERGKETLGRNVESEVVNAKDLPDTFTLKIPLYKNHGMLEPHTFRVRVDADASNFDEPFTMLLDPDAIDLAVNSQLYKTAFFLQEKLNHAGVYLGQHQGV